VNCTQAPWKTWLLTSLLFLSRLIGQAADGDVDSGFDPNASANVYGMALQPDGRIVIGGNFASVGGTNRNSIARLNTDGSLDSSFNPNANNQVGSVAVQPDGKILIGGSFTNVGGASFNRIARLNSDGTVDSSFNPNASDLVQSIAVQPDGRIVIAGEFGVVGGKPHNHVARLNADGTLDSGFNPNVGGIIASIAVQPDGKILVGGWFTVVGGITRNRIARLNADGTLDANFNPNASDAVMSIAVQADGKVLIGGAFTAVGGTGRSYVARLNADGTLDNSFNPNANNFVYTLALQADGRILVGGWLTGVAGTTLNHIARLNADGSVDSSFNPNADGYVYSIAIQADGEVLLGGQFGNLGGTARNHIGRVMNGAATQVISMPDNTQVQWLRGGTAPEVGAVTFESSTDGGNTWMLLGNGTRVGGGWGLGGLSLAPTVSIRARGRTRGGNYDGSSGLIEQVTSFSIADTLPPVLTCPPDVTVNADPGRCYASGVALGTPTASDNSGSVTMSSNAPAQFPLGTNTVIWTATDPSGNTNTCSQQVIVLESAPPSVTCPANMTVQGSSFSGSVVSFPLTINGGCSPQTLYCAPPSGSIFPIGSTVVTATLVDGCGVTNQSSFTVTVLVPPVTINTSLSDAGMVLTWPFGVLQASGRVNGIYTNVPNAASPFTITPTGPQQYYYRVKVQ
jgi:uncharacterized delta-60 repeat protein